MPDYNDHGFHQGDDGAVFGNPDPSATGSRGDYEVWDWKQIMAAINGMSSGVGNEANRSHARAISDPQSLQDAANTFYRVQKALEAVGKSLVDQAKALAGDDGPWRGAAADSFLDTMTTFSRQVLANAKVLSGGSTGMHSVPHQLANNAVTLRNAQLKIVEIDTWYANRAQALGITPMSNGLIPISLRPELVHAMSEDMRVVLKTLASHYQFTSDAIVSPQPVPSPVDGPGTGDGPNTADLPGGGPGPLPDPAGIGGGLPGGGDLADLAGGGLGGAGGLGDPGDLGGVGGLDGVGGPGDLKGLDGSAFPGGLDLGGPGRELPGLPGLNGLDPLSSPGLGGLGGPGSVDSLRGLDGLGGAGLGALSAIPPLALGGTAGLGGIGALPEGLATGRGTTSGLAGFPRGLGLGGRVGATGPADGEEKAAEELRDGAPVGLPAGAATESALPAGLAGAGMPFMPGMGGASNRSENAGERSDASGLLTPSAEPWETGTEQEEREAGSDTGAAAGGEGLTVGGVPFLPAAGPAAAARDTGDGTGSRSEASGLLDAGTDPWTASGPVAAGPAEASAGAPAGAGPAVVLPGFGTPAAAGPGAAAVPSAGAQGGAGSAEDRTAVLPRPAVDGAEEDTALWERGAGAFVPLLWAAGPGRDSRSADEADGGSTEAAEPWSTWQPDRLVSGTAGGSGDGTGVTVPLVTGCGDGLPEPAAPAEEAVSADADQADETAGRSGVAHLLVQDESTWGAVPDRSASGTAH
ncbi:WXG100 family type VII secretion target [Kitasatospora sp. NPDC097643]|uniref:WXG100 family type VII secretion target n=1 Tax=Kitasatospora sp. NPDC097643 TaxID=3157230 RepID=UPI00331A6F8A